MADKEYSDEQLREALIKTNGQPTKAAEVLGVTYVSVYGRIRKNPELLEVQKSARQKTFQDLSNFQVTAVLAGIMKSPEFEEDGSVKKDKDGKTVYMEAVVGTQARMEYASRLMTLFKSDEGIKDGLDFTTNGKDISPISFVKASELTEEQLNQLNAGNSNTGLRETE